MVEGDIVNYINKGGNEVKARILQCFGNTFLVAFMEKGKSYATVEKAEKESLTTGERG